MYKDICRCGLNLRPHRHPWIIRLQNLIIIYGRTLWFLFLFSRLSNSSWFELNNLFLFYSGVFQMALLRCNLYTIQFTYLKCTIQQVLLYLQNCTTIMIVKFGAFLSPRKETPYPLQYLSIGPKPPPPFLLPAPLLLLTTIFLPKKVGSQPFS